jgi:integrase
MTQEELLEIGRKAADGTLTIREAMSARIGEDGKQMQSARTALNKIKSLGYDLDANWSTVSTDKFLRALDAAPKPKSQFTELSATEGVLRSLAAQSAPGAKYAYELGYGASGRATELKLKGMVQYRGTSEAGKKRIKFKSVPEGKLSLPPLIEGLNAITEDSVILNPDTLQPLRTKGGKPKTIGPKAGQIRDAVAVSLMIPLRPGEIRSIGIDDIDFETGQFTDKWQRKNKIRNPVELDEVLLEVLRDAKDRAVANGQKVLFDITDTQLLNGIRVQGGIMEQMVPFEGTLGRRFRNALDTRKIIPSLMHGELNSGIELSTIMGHNTYDEMMGSLKQMTAVRYVSPLIREGEGTEVKKTMRDFRNFTAEVLGLETLNQLPSALGVTASRLEAEGAPKLVVRKTGDGVKFEESRRGTLTPQDADEIADIKETNMSVRAAQREEAGVRVKRAQLESGDLDVKLAEQDAENREIKRRARVRARGGEDADTLANKGLSDADRAALEAQGLDPDKYDPVPRGVKTAAKTTAATSTALLASKAAKAAGTVIPGPDPFELAGAVIEGAVVPEGERAADIAVERGQKFVGDLLGVEARKAEGLSDLFTKEVAAETIGGIGGVVADIATLGTVSGTGPFDRSTGNISGRNLRSQQLRERQQADEGFIPKP